MCGACTGIALHLETISANTIAKLEVSSSRSTDCRQATHRYHTTQRGHPPLLATRRSVVGGQKRASRNTGRWLPNSLEEFQPRPAPRPSAALFSSSYYEGNLLGTTWSGLGRTKGGPKQIQNLPHAFMPTRLSWHLLNISFCFQTPKQREL